MKNKRNIKSDSLIPPLIITLHLLIFSITFSSSDYLSYLTISSILYHTVFVITIIFYLITSLKDPGVIESLKLVKPVPTHPTEPQSLDFSHNLPQSTNEKNPEKPTEAKEIDDENSGPISISVLGKNPIHDSDEEQEPPDRISVVIQQSVEESSLHIETRYCTKCSIEQPLRAKHCKYCDVCIALYDHHCPWMGNCIGERNKFFFWWYLLFELLIISWTLRVLITGIEETSGTLNVLQRNWKVIIGIIVSGLFEIFVAFLFGFHCYLVVKNKTTWEQLSWNNISYLNKWPKNLGSPFSQGVLKNIHYFCCRPLPKGYTLWVYPTKIPS